MNLKGLHFEDVAEIQEAVKDELKKVQEDEFSTDFRKCTTDRSVLYIPMEFILNKEMYVSS